MADETQKEPEAPKTLDDLIDPKAKPPKKGDQIWVGKNLNRKQHEQLCGFLGIDATENNGADTFLAMLRKVMGK